MPANELAAWLRLLLSPAIGRTRARALLAAFGSPEGVFEASASDLRAHLGTLYLRGVLDEPDGWQETLAATQEWLSQGDGRSVVTLGQAAYPRALLETADPPLLLHVQGRVELLNAASIAIVGSRNTSAQGEINAKAFATHLSRAGLTIVSGLALGIDGAAHEGGLLGCEAMADGMGGSTIAVVGTGLDRVYPRRHLDLARRIAADGLLVSEFTIGTPPRPEHFPLRNRIIAGLSLGTLVVEAAMASGSLITARQALEMGREVFAIPGSIHSPQSRGCHSLIKQGAKLVEAAEDVLDELQAVWPGREATARTARLQAEAASIDTDPLLRALGGDPVTLDALIERTGQPAGILGGRLLELELEGQVERLPGGLFQRRFAA